MAPSQRLTLAQAQAEAVKNSPLVAAASDQVTGARANLAGQRVPTNPTFFVAGLNNTVASSNFKNPSNYDVILPIETNGAIQWRTSQARNQLTASQADSETTRLSVRQAVADAYIDLQVANAALDNEVEAYGTADKLSDLTEKQFSLGAAPETNAIRARIALTQEEGNLLTAVSGVRLARANLNVRLGRSASEPIDVADPLVFEPVHVRLERLQAAAEANRPELKSARANLRSLRAATGLQRTQYFPELFLGTDFRSIRQGVFQIGLQIPLFDFGSIRGSIKKAEQDALVQEAQTLEVDQAIGLDVETGYDTLVRTLRTVQAFQDGILPRSASLLERIEKGYQLGASTVLDLIDAQSTYRSVRNDYASALGDYRHALVQIERAIGGPIPTEGENRG